MKKTIAASLITILSAAVPVFAAGNGALAELAGSGIPQSGAGMVPAVSAPLSVGGLTEKATLSWADEVKKAYKQHLETGKLFTLPAAKNSELPPAALKQLNRDNQAARVATPYKLTVKNRQTFVVHNKRDGRSLTAHIFEAKGKLVAVAKAAASTPLYWEDLSGYASGSGGSGYYGPDDVWDGMGGNGPSGGGPDDTYDGGGCGGSGGFDGNSGSGPDDVGGNGI